MAEYIKREDVKRLINNNFSGLLAAIDSITAADVETVVHGRWIATHDEFCSCSLCKYPVCVAWGQTNYCPNCGAKMDGNEE